MAQLEQATAAQIDENPVMLYARARLRISQAVAPDVTKQVLFHDGMIPQRASVHNDAAGKKLLADAQADLTQLEPALDDLDTADFSVLVDLNLVFLALCAGDPAERALARTAMIERLTNPADEVRLAPLAIQYGVNHDWTQLRERLSRAETLGGYDEDQLRAAFALVMNDGDPAIIADFAHRYGDRLEGYLTKDSAVAIEVEALARAGRVAGAKELLQASRAELSGDTCAFLERTITEAEGGDPVAVRLAQFEATGSTHDLHVLVDAMRSSGDARAGEHLIELWRRRRQVSDAREACDILVSNVEELRADQFLDELGDEARLDPVLRTHLAWSLYRQGRLSEAQKELDALGVDGIDSPNTRHLTVRLAVETGRWPELEPFVQRQLSNGSERSATELLEAAHIACAIGSSITFDLLRAAVAKAPEDAAVNLQAYTIATEGGFERSAEVSGWFGTAVSRDDGRLIQTKKFSEVVELIREGRDEADRIGGMINAADIPVAMGVGMLGGTQSSLVLGQMAFNAEQTDSRRRSVVPLYAGNRTPRTDLQPRSVSFDPIALLVLDYLGLLELALSSFDDVVLPSQTLHSFFEDRAKAAHSQPSRVSQAQLVKEAIAREQLIVEDLSGLENDFGPMDQEFIALFSAANSRDRLCSGKSPLHPAGTVEETVDPKPYAHRLVSPKGLLASLRERGLISEATASSAQHDMAGSGAAWDGEPSPETDKPLFLTTLAVQYLSDASLLPVLKAHSGKLIIGKRTAEIADNEIAAGDAARKVREGIERIRAVLARAISDGRARVGPAHRQKDELEAKAEVSPSLAPIMSTLRDSAGIEAFVLRRSRHEQISSGNRSER